MHGRIRRNRLGGEYADQLNCGLCRAAPCREADESRGKEQQGGGFGDGRKAQIIPRGVGVVTRQDDRFDRRRGRQPEKDGSRVEGREAAVGGGEQPRQTSELGPVDVERGQFEGTVLPKDFSDPREPDRIPGQPCRRNPKARSKRSEERRVGKEC